MREEFKPYLDKESAIEWLSRHMAGVGLDRTAMYHLEIITNLIDHGEEIFKRIPPEVFGGLPEGGLSNVQASVILRAEARADKQEPTEVLPSGYTREQELIGRWAEMAGCWEDYAEAAQEKSGRRFLTSGSEAMVFDGGDKVFKTIDLNHYGSVERLLDRISIHNALFPETRMVVEGFGMRDDAEDSTGFVAIVSQPFIEGGICPDSATASAKLTEKALEHKFVNGVGFFFSVGEDVVVCDLHDENVIYDRDGNLHVFDCDIRLNTYDGPAHGSYAIPEVTFTEESIGAIGDLLKRIVPKSIPRDVFESAYSVSVPFLKEQLETTGRIDGALRGGARKDFYCAALDPGDSRTVLMMPCEGAALMLDIAGDQFTEKETAILAEGRGIFHDGRFLAFDPGTGRVAEAVSFEDRLRKDLGERERLALRKSVAPQERAGLKV